MSFLIDQIDSSGLFAQSAYSASIATKDSNGNDITATYLTGVDLSPYQTTAGMTGYATTGDVSGTQWNSCYETVYSNSGSWTGGGGGSFTGVTTDATLTGNGLSTNPLGVAEVQSLTSDESINITLTGDNVVLGVADTWFNDAVNSAVTGTQGDAEVNNEVHTNSGNWNNSYTTITANSGAWGGSALPISAGPGISAGIVNNTLVFRNDETLLFSGNINPTSNTGTLSEIISNFEKIKIYSTFRFGSDTQITEHDGTSTNFYLYSMRYDNAVESEGGLLTVSNTNLTLNSTWHQHGTSVSANDGRFYCVVSKIVGINRINNA